MASISFNPLVENASGRYGRIILRRRGGKVFLARPPSVPPAPLTPPQVDHRLFFQDTVAYSKAVFDVPARREPYAALAKEQQKGAFALIMGDFLAKPVIRGLDTSGYHGHLGDAIALRTRDDLGVTSVAVVLRGNDERELERGEATLADGAWTYVATTEVPAGTEVQLEVVATDSSALKFTAHKAFVVG